MRSHGRASANCPGEIILDAGCLGQRDHHRLGKVALMLQLNAITGGEQLTFSGAETQIFGEEREHEGLAWPRQSRAGKQWCL
jgi:hypothetical protein